LFLKKQLIAADESDAAAREFLRNMQRVLALSRSAIARQAGHLIGKLSFQWSNSSVPEIRVCETFAISS
jgi:hypothetical protein